MFWHRDVEICRLRLQNGQIQFMSKSKHLENHLWDILGCYFCLKQNWLVVGPPLWKILVNWDDYSQYIYIYMWENKKCSKPPTRKGRVSSSRTFSMARDLSWTMMQVDFPWIFPWKSRGVFCKICPETHPSILFKPYVCNILTLKTWLTN